MNDKDVMIKQIIESDDFIGTKYYQFLKLAIEINDESRYRLIDYVPTLLQLNYSNKKISKNNLYNLLNPTLFRINKLLIDNKDFKLFKYQINHFTTFLILESPMKIINGLEHDLYLLSDSFDLNNFMIKQDNEIKCENRRFNFLIRYGLLYDFEQFENISNEINDYQIKLLKKIDEFKDKDQLKSLKIEGLNVEDEKVYNEIIKDINKSKENIIQIIQGNEKRSKWGIRPQLYEFWISSLIYKTFFMIGAYLVYYCREKDITLVNYFRELWFHTKPTENRTIILANTPISFDSFWLIFLYLFGGIGTPRWLDWPNYLFDDYYESKQYVTQYFLLSLSKTDNINIFPSKKEIESMAKYNPSHLELFFDLVYGFQSDHSNLINNIDLLINENEKWDSLLSYKETLDGKEYLVTAKNVLKKTKESINELMPKLKELEAKITDLLPLNKEKIDRYFEDSYKYYKENSLLLKNFYSREFNEEEDSKKKFVNLIGIDQLIDRGCVVKTGTILFFDCDTIWDNAIRKINNEEFKLLHDTIIENFDKKPILLENSTCEEIYKIISEISKNDNNPDMIILPKKIFYGFLKLSVKKENILYKKINHKTIHLNNDLVLEIIKSPFNKIIIFNKKYISYIYKSDLNNKKKVIVKLIEVDEISKIKLIIKIQINIKVANSNKINIFELSN